MRCRLQRTSALGVLMGVLAVAPVGCAGGRREGDGSRSAAARATPSQSDAPRPPEVAKLIVIDNFTFNPPRLAVSVGTKVTWVNRDDVPHTATSTEKPKRFS